MGDEPGGGMMRDVVTLISGTAIAQVITVIATPVITRIYDPAAFGMYAVFLSLVSIVGAVACLRYENSIMLPESDDEAASLAALCLVILTATTALLAVVLWLFGGPVSLALNSPQLAPWLLLVPVAVFLTGLSLVLTFTTTRRRLFRLVSVSRMAGSGTTAAGQVGLGTLWQASAGGLVGSYILGLFVAVVTLGAEIRHVLRDLPRRAVSRASMAAGFRKYRNFPIYDTWSALLNTVSGQLPVLLFSSFFTAAVVGYYSVSLLVLWLPISLVSAAVGQVFYQRGAAAVQKGREALGALVGEISENLVLVSLFPAIAIVIAGREGFTLVFGPQWGEAGTFSQILAPWIFLIFITSPLSTIFAILGEQRTSLLFNVLSLGVRVAAIAGGAWFGDPVLAVLLFSLAGVACNGAMYAWLLRAVGLTLPVIRRPYLRYGALSLPFAAVIAGAKWVLALPAVPVVVITLACTGLYYLAARKYLP
ncbi:MAG TPA: oligosaccharide flippase family protein [Methanomicrobiales archaeon]|nr:oligosaccharide flippase family protein [Methanomicrobiales archaeon]